MIKSILPFLFAVLFSIKTFGFGENSLGARSGAMGGVSTTSSNSWSALNNQAGLAFVKKPVAGLNYDNRFLIASLGVKAFSAAYPIKAGTFGLGIRSFGFSTYAENKYSASFGRTFTEKLSVGLAINYVRVQFGEDYGSSSTLTGELGAQYRFSKSIVFGFHLNNPSRTLLNKSSNERLPTILRIGTTYIFSEKGDITLEVEKDINFKPVVRSGVEYRITPAFALRMGLSTNPSIFTFGFGYTISNFRLDISSSLHPVLGHSPQAGLSYQF